MRKFQGALGWRIGRLGSVFFWIQALHSRYNKRASVSLLFGTGILRFKTVGSARLTLPCLWFSSWTMPYSTDRLQFIYHVHTIRGAALSSNHYLEKADLLLNTKGSRGATTKAATFQTPHRVFSKHITEQL